MKIKFLSTILLLLYLVTTDCFSQNSTKIIDSLKQVIQSKPSDSIKIKTFSDLCWYYRSVSTDSAFTYGNRALNLAKTTKNRQGEAQAYNDLGILYYDASNFKKAITYYKKTKHYREIVNDSMGMASAYNKLGIAYQRIFKMDSAIYYATNALKIYEDKNHVQYAAIIKNNIANIYQDLKQYDKALKTHLEVADIRKEIKDLNGLTYSYTNIGNAYLFLKDTLQALNYYTKGIEIAKRNNFKGELATLYNNLGSVYKGQKKFYKAIEVYNKSFDIRKKLNDNYGVASAAINIGSLYLSSGKINQAEEKLRFGLNISKKTEAKELELTAYGSLLSYFAFKKNTDSILHYQNLYNSTQDSIFSDRITKQVAEVQEKYDAAEREKKILLQRADIAEKELNLNQKNTQLLGLGILAVVIALLGYLLFNQQKLKNAQLKKESELKEALVKIETQNRLQEQRLRISRDLHDNIGAQLTFIISSIDNLKYGFKITNDKLNTKLDSISDFTKDTIYELRDTIWAMNKNEISLEDLQARVSNFVDKASASANKISFNFNIDPSLSKDKQFTSVKGMNIYRIIQEAVNNAIKYAKATSINVNIKEDANLLQLSIIDDGIGFDKTKIKSGNGLNNIKKRAQDINATININSVLGKGTSVKLTM